MLPTGTLNLQQVVRDLEKRLSAVESHPALSVPALVDALEKTHDGPAEAASAEEPAKVD